MIGDPLPLRLMQAVKAHTPQSQGPLRAFWHSRDLLWQFTRRNIQLRHKGSYLGFLWLMITPLMMLALYTFTFGLLLGGSFGMTPDEGPADYALGIFLGFTLYGLVSETMGASPHVILANTNLVKKVVFPLEVLPAANVLSACYTFSISLGLFLIGMALFGPPLTLGVLWLPVIVLPLILLSLGLGWLLSGLGVFFRDVQHVILFLSTALFYASGIFYSAASVQAEAPQAWAFLRWNPIFQAIELSRDAVLWQIPVDLAALGYLYVSCSLVAVIGLAAFRKLKSGFADVL